jgi:signal transduction histidine kinase
MKAYRPVPRYLGILVLLALAGFAAVGFFSIRKDVEDLRLISQDNTQWSASQMEVELPRFRLKLAAVRLASPPEALDEMHERFDILWSRVFMMGSGHVGESLRRYDAEQGSVAALGAYLQEIDPEAQPFDLSNDAEMNAIEAKLAGFQQDLREYTLRVVRADAAAAEQVQERIKTSARTTAMISVAAMLISVLSLVLILREIRRQHDLVELSQRSAEQAESASRAKSRFLTMMSHELRNPLNGILGPLALLGQAELSATQRRLVGQAQNSGGSMLRMLAGLLDYGEVQDGRIHLRNDPLRIAALAESLQAALNGEGVEGSSVHIDPGTPARINGDAERLQQVFTHLAVYMLEGRDSSGATVTFSYDHDHRSLVGEIAFSGDSAQVDWRLDLLMGLSEIPADQVTAEALRPLIARGLISALHGILTLLEPADGRQIIRVSIPAEAISSEQIRVHLETRSAALATIYRAALRSDRLAFVPGDYAGRVDVVLVDSTGVGEVPTMSRLRQRFPGALFVSLGLPQTPDFFDDIVETPNDMTRLRTSILGRLAS